MKRIGLYLFIIGITFIKAYGQEDSGPVNTGAANYLTIPVDARSAAMGGAGVAISRGNNAVFHNGAATLSEAMHKGGVTYTYSPWMRDYESGYSLHSLGGFYKGEFYQFNLSSCIRQQNSLTAQFVSFSLSNLANIFYPRFLQ